ncbi:MAG TPA: NADH-quinone oxidoreductase subunit M, partial [Gammaproteobacteria bacterium]
MFDNFPLLSVVIWLPIFGGIAVLLAGRAGDNAVRWLSLAVSIAAFLVSIPLYTGFDFTTAQMQFVEFAPWIEALNVNYHLGVDGIAVPLILLTTFMTVLVVIA